MTEALRTYLLAVTAACLFSSILLALVPQGSVKRAMTFVCGLAVILTALGPVVKLDAGALARSISRAKIASDETASGITVDNRALISAIIKEKTETYIWDKAEELGFRPSVRVTMEDGGDYPYPARVSIAGTFTEAQKKELSEALEEELAIPKECQEWSSDGTQ